MREKAIKAIWKHPNPRALTSLAGHKPSCLCTLHTFPRELYTSYTAKLTRINQREQRRTTFSLRLTGAMSNSQRREKSSAPGASKSKQPMEPRPSSSILLISPTNQILLLCRVQTSSAFPSAHVFPGGNVSKYHDGEAPPATDLKRHEDSEVYRLAAIRETFEESGVLLARNNGFGRLIEVRDEVRQEGRKEIHAEKVPFRTWLARHGGRADVDGLIPFTRWVTPTNVPKRFTTQMYIYFLPISGSDPRPDSQKSTPEAEQDAIIPTPTHDGGIEHTQASYLPAWKWLEMARAGEIILFPPQFFLLHIIAPYLSPKDTSFEGDADRYSPEELQQQRQKLKDFLKLDEDPSWAEKVISPIQLLRRKSDNRTVLGLDKPGPELKDSGRVGERERVALVDFRKEGPRNVEIRWKKDILEEERLASSSSKL